MTARALTLAALLAVLTGCNSDPPSIGSYTDVTGTAKYSDGKPVADVVISFYPQAQGANQQSAPTDGTGAFKIKLIPSKYVVVLEKGQKADAYKAVPDSYKSPNGDNAIELTPGQSTLEVTVKK